MAVLRRKDIESELAGIKDWKIAEDDASIFTTYRFKTFPEAISFMVRIGFICEEMNHHPDWSNSYNRVKVTLTTHDAGGVTAKDLELARAMDDIMWR